MEDTKILNRILEQYGDQIINVYRQKLANSNSNATGRLGNSLSVTVQVEEGLYSLDIQLEDYWKYIEEGRQPGKWPNIQAIKDWITIKPILPNIQNGKVPSIDSLAYLIARSIKENGIEARPFLQETLDSLDWQPFETAVTEDVTHKVDLILDTIKE